MESSRTKVQYNEIVILSTSISKLFDQFKLMISKVLEYLTITLNFIGFKLQHKNAKSNIILS